MPMRPDQIEQAQALLTQVQKIHDAHAEVITGDFSLRTLDGDNILKLIEHDDAYERIKLVIAGQLAIAFQQKLDQLRTLNVDVSAYKLAQISDFA